MAVGTNSGWTKAACLAPLVLFLGVYLPTAGHGFIQDDYSWILQNRVRSIGELLEVFRRDNGFYRPVVALTFTLNEWMFGANAFGYGMTNVVLALLCCASIVRLARAVRLPWGAATLAGALWLLNFHGIRMSVLWISGRTALVLTLAATAAATSLMRGHVVAATAWLIVALFAKEEAILLPIILLVWLRIFRTPALAPRIRPWTLAICAAVAEAVYLRRAPRHRR